MHNNIGQISESDYKNFTVELEINIKPTITKIRNISFILKYKSNNHRLIVVQVRFGILLKNEIKKISCTL